MVTETHEPDRTHDRVGADARGDVRSEGKATLIGKRRPIHASLRLEDHIMSPIRSSLGTLAAASLITMLAACSHDSESTGPAEARLTQDEAVEVTSAMLDELSSALDNISFGRVGNGRIEAALPALPAVSSVLRGEPMRHGVSIAPRFLAPSVASAVAPTATGSAPCRLGGRMYASATFVDNTDANGTGSVSATVSMNPQDCVVSTGTKLITVNGDPSLDMSFQMNFLRGNLNSDIVWRGSGAIRWDGGRCAMNFTATLDALGEHGTMRGTICGYPVNESI